MHVFVNVACTRPQIDEMEDTMNRKMHFHVIRLHHVNRIREFLTGLLGGAQNRNVQ
jgi:hypothetical protein